MLLSPDNGITNQNLNSFLMAGGGIDQETAEIISAGFEYKCVRKNDFHLKEGSVSDEYFFLEKGTMRAFVHTPDGREITTEFYPPGKVGANETYVYLASQETNQQSPQTS